MNADGAKDTPQVMPDVKRTELHRMRYIEADPQKKRKFLYGALTAILPLIFLGVLDYFVRQEITPRNQNSNEIYSVHMNLAVISLITGIWLLLITVYMAILLVPLGKTAVITRTWPPNHFPLGFRQQSYTGKLAAAHGVAAMCSPLFLMAQAFYGFYMAYFHYEIASILSTV